MTGFVTNTDSVRNYYAELGFDTLPLLPGSKQAGIKAWQSRSPQDLWQEGSTDSNIGIRCSGPAQVAVIDCDEKETPGTFKNAKDFMFGLGYSPGSYPVIQTASGIGRHIYIQVENPPKGNYRKLVPEFGGGEFRYGPGAYVAAPPSVVKGMGNYILLEGEFKILPQVTQNDILPLIQPEESKNLTKPNIRHVSRFAWRLLQGEIPHHYPSRSEAEQALITSLINTGCDFDKILSLFIMHPGPGKFQEKYLKDQKGALSYLKHSFDEAKPWASINISPGRKRAQNAYDWAISRPWPGRTGGYDWAVFLAHTQIAWKCGKKEYAASVRRLADIVNISHMAAANANRRLQKIGYITKTQNAVANLANIYRLGKIPLSYAGSSSNNLSAYSSHDVFSYQALGKSSEHIWFFLQDCPKTLEAIVKQTGRTRRTARKRLDEMSKIVDIRTGEIHSMVNLEDGLWHANKEINLDFIAELLGVFGILGQRKRIHQHQRDIHRRALERGRIISGGNASV